MADWYNMTQINGTSVLKLTQTVNTVLFNGLIGYFIILLMFVITYRAAVTFNNNPKISILYSSFFIAVISVFLKLLSLANDITVFICWALLAIVIAFNFLFD